MPAPESAIISTNSPTGGMSSFSILAAIILVASHDIPGRTPISVGMCMPGLPTVATLMWPCRFLVIASSPKKVKKTLASMPSMRAPLAMIRPG